VNPDLKWCGYCQSWHSKPCGEGCCWSPTDPTLEQMKIGMKPVYVKEWRTTILVSEEVVERAKANLAITSGVRESKS